MTAKASSRRPTSTLAILMACVALAAIALLLAAPSAEATGPHNQFLAVNVGDDGLFNIGAYPAADGTDTADSWDISYSWPRVPWSSFTTIRVDGGDYIYGTAGSQVTPPTDVSATKNSSAWQTTSDIQVTQQLSLVANSATGRQDVAQIEYTVTNTGAVAHSVGVRLMVDTEIWGTDDALFRVPGVGALTAERDFTGAAVPRGVYVFATPSDTTHIAFIACGSTGAAPNRMVFAYWPSIHSPTDAPWDYTVDPIKTFGDSAYAMYWDPATLAAGQSRTYVSSYGLGASNVDLRPPLALGVYGPSQLNVVDGSYSPNPFDVSAWVSDLGPGAASNVKAKIVLPVGLQLASGRQTQTLGALEMDQEKQASWSVRALQQGTARTLSYKVTVWGDNADPKTVTRVLKVPAVAVVTPTVTLKLSGLTSGAITLGRRVTAKGKVTPTSLAGSKVTLKVQRKKSGRWVTVKTTARLISATGTYNWKYKPLKRGAYRMQAVIAWTTTHMGAKTVWRKFKVT